MTVLTDLGLILKVRNDHFESGLVAAGDEGATGTSDPSVDSTY